MSLGALLLAVWLILLGGTWVGWWTVGPKFLGFWALLTGIIWLVEAYHPLPIWKNKS